MQSVIADIADRDPRLAIRLAESQGPVVSGSLTELIATQWSRQNPSEAGRWVEGLSRPDQARYAYRVADAYVAQKPSEALAWALRLAGSPQRYLWSSMLGQMAKYDPDQALQIAQAADSPAQRAQAMGKVLAAIAQTDPSMAMTQLLKLPSGRMRSEILGEVARSVATLSPTAALDWLNDIDDDSMQLEAAQSLGWALSRRNVEAAAQLVDRVPKEARANWITAVALGYAEFDVEKGRQWVRRYGNESASTSRRSSRASSLRVTPSSRCSSIGDVTDDQERDRLLRGAAAASRRALSGAGGALGRESHGRRCPGALHRRGRRHLGAVRSARRAQMGHVAQRRCPRRIKRSRRWCSGAAARSTTCCRSSTRSRRRSGVRMQC